MNEILFHYEKIDPTTWVYLSSLLIIGLFFKFGRFWSVRNLDLALLLLLAPGLLLVSEGQVRQLRARDALAAQRADGPTAGAANEGTPRDQEPPGQGDDGDGGDGDGGEKTNSDSTSSAAEPTKPSEDRVIERSSTAAGEGRPSRLAESEQGRTLEIVGFLWLLAAGVLLATRLLLDPTMVRRPLLEPNLTTGGLIFSCCSLFVFLMANVVSSRPTADDLRGPISAERWVSGRTTDDLDRHGPGYALLFMLPSLPTVKMGAALARQRVEDPAVRIRPWRFYSRAGAPQLDVEAEFLEMTSDRVVRIRKLNGLEVEIPWADLSDKDRGFVRKIEAYTTVAKLMAILSHLAVIIGMIAIGYWHFHNLKMGVGAATLYLMLPYTSQMTGRVDHVLPAALLIWSVLCYRRPLVSGIFVGLAIGVIYYPLFLLPLWFSFYWRRGLFRFAGAVVAILAILVLMLAFVSPDTGAFLQSIKEMFGLRAPQMEGLGGIWGLGWKPVYRYPVLAAFAAVSGSLAIWPAQKNLGTLLSCSAAVMVATQFWHGYGGGLFIAWYLPLLLMTVTRPNLEDRVAVAVVNDTWSVPSLIRLPRR